MIALRNKIAVGGSRVYRPIPPGTFSKPIQVKKELVFQNAFKFASDSYGNLLVGQNLTDLSTINNVDGVPTGLPANGGIQVNLWDYHKVDWYNVKTYNLIFDLNDVYNLDYAYVYSTSHNINIWGSEDGVIYKELAPRFEQHYQKEWLKIDFVGEARANNRYFIIGLTYYDASIEGFVLYGRPSGEKVNKGVKYNRKVADIPTHEHMGSNGFYLERPEMMSKVCGTNRFYVVPSWLLGKDFERPGQGKGKTVDQIKQRFTTADEGNVDQWLQGFKNTFTKTMFDINASPAFLRPLGTQKADLSKALDPQWSTLNLSDTTDPMKYTFIARIVWNIAARYGANKDIDTQFINLEPNNPIRVGLNLIDALEIGNEFDRWWDGAQCYHNPQEMAAYMSAIYDGHKGAMGLGFGIKNADPSMKVSIVSTASGDNVDYLNEMIWWFNKYRGPGDFAFDIINYHWYNSSEGSQDAAEGSFGVPPEFGTLREANLKWVNFRDRYCPSVEVWLTEVGYDEHLGGVFSPNYGTQFERSRYKSYWLMRTYMINQFTGVDVTNQYWYANHAGTRLQDFNDYEAKPDKFLTMGMVDGIQSASDYNRFPLMSYWYVANLKSHLTDYLYQHMVMSHGIPNTEGTVIETNGNSHVWAMAYKNFKANKTILVIWLDTAEMTSLPISITVPEGSVTRIVMDEAEIRQSLTGVTSVVNAVGGKVNITINECPLIIETSNIGIPKTIQAEDVEVQRINNGKSLITWLDKNIKPVDAVIRRSTNPDSGFVKFYQGPVFNGEFVDETNDNVYYYRVELIRAGSPPVIDPEPGNETWKTAFHHAYFATSSLNDAGTAATNGQEVRKIKDLIGTMDMNYVGLEQPLLSKAKPRFYNNIGGFIFLPNETNVQYLSALEPVSVFPRERWFIGTLANYQMFEAFFNNYNTEYLGDMSTGGLRTRNGQDNNQDLAWFTPVALPLNKTFLIRQLFTDDAARSDRVNIQMWINGVKVTKLLTGNKVAPDHGLGIGADTNNSHYGFKAIFFKNEMIPTQLADQLTSELMLQHNVNQPLTVPYADNLIVDRVDTTYTAKYSFKAINGIPENVANRKVKWIYSYDGITFSIYMPELEGLMSFNASDYPQYDIVNKEVRVEIICEDMQGRKFMIPQSYYRAYN